MPDLSYDAILCELGDKLHLSEAEAHKAGRDLLNMMLNSEGPVSLMIGGYDDDPRSLWEIPEVAQYLRWAVAAAHLQDWTSPLFQRLREPTMALLVQCDAIDRPHPYRAEIVVGAPAL